MHSVNVHPLFSENQPYSQPVPALTVHFWLTRPQSNIHTAQWNDVTKPHDKLNIDTREPINDIADIYKEHLLMSYFQKKCREW